MRINIGDLPENTDELPEDTIVVVDDTEEIDDDEFWENLSKGNNK